MHMQGGVKTLTLWGRRFSTGAVGGKVSRCGFNSHLLHLETLKQEATIGIQRHHQ